MQAHKIEIFDWMTAKGYLGLTGLDLLIYAYIYNEVEVTTNQIVDELGIDINIVRKSFENLGGHAGNLIICTNRNVHHPEKCTYVINEDRLL